MVGIGVGVEAGTKVGKGVETGTRTGIWARQGGTFGAGTEAMASLGAEQTGTWIRTETGDTTALFAGLLCSLGESNVAWLCAGGVVGPIALLLWLQPPVASAVALLWYSGSSL